MSNLIIIPILLPFLAGAILIFFAKSSRLQKIISAFSVLALIGISVYLTFLAYQDTIILEAGEWAAPYGIILVLDNFAALMLLITSILAAACLFFAFGTISEKREKFYFYPFYFFLLVGVNGAFLTGDIFNLFVFFEVMLLSSYVLIVNGGSKYQLRESFKYVILNVFASALFVMAVAWLYSVTGTVNMAHLSERVAELGQPGILTVIAVMFFIVFGSKGALFPLYFWLPRSYYGPPAAIAALFGGLLTKVGIYAIIRSFTLIFYHEPLFTHKGLITVVAGLTMFFGVLGAVSQFDFKRILSYHIISQVGYMVMGLGIFTPLAVAGAIFYIVHHMFVKTALFLLAGATEKITGTTDIKEMGGLIKSHPALTWGFFIAAISLAGIPPLSGFFSKFPIILSGFQEGQWIIAAVALLVGLLTLFSMMKIFGYVFWGENRLTGKQYRTSVTKLLIPIAPLVAFSLVLGFAAEPVFAYSLHIAEQILEPSNYVDAVLKE